MPKLLPSVCNLRDETVRIVDKLVSTGRYNSYKQAFTHVYNQSKVNDVPCGFNQQTLETAYIAFRCWKHNYEIET